MQEEGQAQVEEGRARGPAPTGNLEAGGLEPAAVATTRTPDLHAGQYWISDDFDAPLPDSFWLGEE